MIARAIWALAGALAFAIAAPSPLIACGDTPALGAEIDRMIAIGHAQKAQPDIDAVRARMAYLARSGEDAQARELEKEAMRRLGFEKRWLRCGGATFAWFPIEHKNGMVGPAPKPASKQ